MSDDLNVGSAPTAGMDGRPGVGAHEPTPEFRARLEWQIRSALRRESRFARPATGGWRRRARAAVVIIAALGLGGVGGVASAQVQDAQRRYTLLANAQSELELAQLRLELARTDFEQVEGRFEAGLASRATLHAAQSELRTMESAFVRLQLDLEEIQATSSAPLNELSAPLVKGRDFVTERLRIQLETALASLRAVELATDETRLQVEAGVSNGYAQLEADGQLRGAMAAVDLLQSKLLLRERFLQRELSAESLANEQRTSELNLELERAQSELDLARQRVDRLEEAHAAGAVPELEFRRAQVELLELQAAFERVQREIQALRAAGRAGGG